MLGQCLHYGSNKIYVTEYHSNIRNSMTLLIQKVMLKMNRFEFKLVRYNFFEQRKRDIL